MTMEKASNGVSSYTTSLTASLSENKEGYCFWKMRRMIENTRPIKNADIIITTTENFAVLGRDAPSSFDTLTLQIQIQFHVICICFNTSKKKDKFPLWTLIIFNYLMAALNPTAIIFVHPNMFVLQ